MGDIAGLAHHLRDNGDPILNAGAKLTLSTVLLHNLNEAFPMLVDTENHNDPFRVISGNGSSLEIFHDLAFLHDFFQRTESLKVVNLPRSNAPNSIDVGKFTILKTLELNKVQVEIVTGLHHLSSQLDTLICTQCLGNLEEILHCYSTHNKTSEWCNLRNGVFSYNGLESIDRFIHYIPWLQVLDLSHNYLTNVNAVRCLPNLKCLNVGYNFLQSLPTFGGAASERLISLTIKFNHLENVEGLFSLNSLQDLDLSCNCLTDHQRCLPSLVGLSSLSKLLLYGNPLSYHKRHRIKTAQLLHINTIHREFFLDGKSLSNTERSVIGSESVDAQSYSASVESSATHSQVEDNASLYQPQKSQPNRRPGRVRDAVISDYEEFEGVSQMNDSRLACSVETSTEHLETKKQIEILRQRFGEENWLHSQSGSCIQSILGLPQSPKPDVLSIISTLRDSKEKIGSEIGNFSQSQPNKGNVVEESTPQKSNTECVPSDSSQDTVVALDQMFSSKDTCPDEQDSDTSEEDDETEEFVYTVQRDAIKLFLVISQFYIREKDITFGKTLEKWSLSSLLSCVLIGSDPVGVQLKYDSFRRERQTRMYFMAEDDAQKIVKDLGKILEARSLQERYQKVHRCLNCSSQFTRELNFWDARNHASCACPNCHSLLVVEMDEVPLPQKSLDNNNVKKQLAETVGILPPNSSILENKHSLAQSPSKSSIGDAARSSVCNPDIIQTVAFIHSTDDADATYNSTTKTTTARSAASLDHSPDWSTSAGETIVQRSDSDIEVISNPSQSSIEVIEDKGTPVRKRSEEPVVEDVLITPAVQAMATLGLTESSSSDSFTESVCTTYENRSYSSLPKGNSIHRTDEKNDESISEENELPDIFKSASILETTLFLGYESHDAHDHRKGSKDALNSNVLEKARECSDKVEIAKRAMESAVKYSYVDYTQVDHRVKLHLYLHVFQEEEEELTLLVRAQVLQQSHAFSYPGCVVFSNRSIYFLEVTGREGDDPDKWLKKRMSFPLKRLTGIFGLPWNQGICLRHLAPDVTLESNDCLLLLNDQQRTLNLVKSISVLSLPEGCHFIECPSPSPVDDLTSAIYLLEDDSPACSLFTIFNNCKIISDRTAETYFIGALLVTKSGLFISQSSLFWLMPHSKVDIEILAVQKMSNLIAVEVTANDCCIELHFLDELTDLEDVWFVSFETEDCLNQIISALQPSWEEIFSVPLEIKVNSRSQIS